MLKHVTNLRNSRICDIFRRYMCSSDVPSKKKEMPKDLSESTTFGDLTSKLEEKRHNSKLATNGDMEWRTEWHKKEGNYYGFLRTLYTEDNKALTLKAFTQPYNMTPSAIKSWMDKRKKEIAVGMQMYWPERNKTLGDELAAAHFILYRRGAIKFYGTDTWLKANRRREFVLPNIQDESYVVQAIDCTDMELYYEGLANLKNLKKVEWLSLNGCEELDDWALDRVSNIFSHSLLYLDLRNMPLITHRGLGCLFKLEKLKILYVDDICASNEIEMTCLSLQELLPNLDIRME